MSGEHVYRRKSKREPETTGKECDLPMTAGECGRSTSAKKRDLPMTAGECGRSTSAKKRDLPMTAGERGRSTSAKKRGLSVREMVIFSFLGALMFVSKQLLEFLPNIHMLGMFVMLFAVVYRVKGLIPIYIFVLLEGVYAGFNLWWVPYIYIWTVLWGATMLLPRNMNPKRRIPVYMAVCSLHGFLYGTLYAPFQALAMGLSFKATIAWIVAGLPWDAVHGLGNLAMGTLVYPLSKVLIRLEKSYSSGN